MRLLLFVILMHFFSDFVLQSDQLASKKESFYLRNKKLFVADNPILIHGMIVFVSLQVLILFFSSWYKLFMLSALVSITHIILDHYKSLQNKKMTRKMGLFLLDQGIHIGSIFLLCSFFDIQESSKYIPLFGSYKTIENNGEWWIPYVPTRIVIMMIVIIVFSYVAGYLISYILDNLKVARKVDKAPKRALTDNEKNIGLKIGLIERLLVIIFVAAGQYGALGLILAGKSLARYEDLKDKAFAEYYLLGTLLSFLFGIIGGLLVKVIG